MTTAIATTKPPATPPAKASALMIMAARISCDPDKLLNTLKATVFQKASNEELLALVVVANEYGLNPFLKEIYAFPAKGGGIVPVVSVDGWNKMLIRQEAFDGIEFEMADKEDVTPYSCTATVYVKGRSRPVKITEYFDECYRKTEPWDNMPRRMLRNRTLCQVARVAFGFSGIYHEDEAQRFIDVSSERPLPKVVRVSTIEPAQIGVPEASPNEELEKFVLESGHTFDTFQKWGEQTGNIPEAMSLTSFADVKADVAKRALRNRAGLLTQLENAKGAQ